MGLGQFLKNPGPGGLSSYLSQLTQPTNTLGQIGKAVSQASGGAWGNALSLLDQQGRQQQQDSMQDQIQQAQLAAMNAKQNRNQIVQLPNGGIAAVDPDTNAISMLREPGAPETHDPASVAAFKYMQGLNPEQQKAYRAMLPGFANTDEGQVQARGMVDYRSAAARATKLAPSYGATHKTGAGVKPPAGFILD